MPITLTIRYPEAGQRERYRADSAPPPLRDGEHELAFDASRIVIGRKSGCDLWIPDPSVSHRHASIRTQGSDYLLFDEGSANGTFVGGVRIEPGASRTLRTGDLVRVGRVWLEVRIGQGAPVPLFPAGATREVALALISSAMAAVGDDVSPRVVVVEGYDVGQEALLRAEGEEVTLGRGDTCTLPISDADASREHVRVVRRGGGVYVMDLGSKNGTYLGERRLPSQQEVAWKSTQALKLGSTVLALVEPVQLALEQIEAAADEALSPNELAEPPPPSLFAPGTNEGAPSSRRVSVAPASATAGSPGMAPASALLAQPVALSERLPDRRAPAAVVATPTPTRKPRSGWSTTDVVMIFAALLVLGLSLAGLAWVLRG